MQKLYAFFWVIPRRLNFKCRRFGTLCLFHVHRQVGACRMNSARGMFGALYGKRFGSEMAWAIRTEGDRVGAGQSTETSCEGSRDPSSPSQTFSRIITQTSPQPSSFYKHLPAYEDGTDSVPKRRHIKFRRRGITQKKAYNIQDTAKVWNKECKRCFPELKFAQVLCCTVHSFWGHRTVPVYLIFSPWFMKVISS